MNQLKLAPKYDQILQDFIQRKKEVQQAADFLKKIKEQFGPEVEKGYFDVIRFLAEIKEKNSLTPPYPEFKFQSEKYDQMSDREKAVFDLLSPYFKFKFCWGDRSQCYHVILYLKKELYS